MSEQRRFPGENFFFCCTRENHPWTYRHIIVIVDLDLTRHRLVLDELDESLLSERIKLLENVFGVFNHNLKNNDNQF